MPRPTKMPGGPPTKLSFGTVKRVFKTLYKSYPVLLPLAIACIIFASITATLPAIFQQQIIEDIQEFYLGGDWSAAVKVILPKILLLVGFYSMSIIAITVQTQLMAYMTQGF